MTALLGLTAAGAAPQITLQQIKTNFTGKFCYVHARGAISPDGTALITTQPLFLKGMDVFYGLEFMKSTDGGKTWSPLRKSKNLLREKYNGTCERVMCDAAPFYHRKTGKFLLTGQSAVYQGNAIMKAPRPRQTLWSVFDPELDDWQKFRELEMPEEKLFFSSGAGSTQIIELENGDLLIPIYAAAPEQLLKPARYSALVLKCSFDGQMLRVKELGPPMTIPVPRGLNEPSLAAFKGEYFLALRNDKTGYVTKSSDGLRYEKPRPLCFDDGKNAGNYCTQQHWITGGGKLYLVYTRRGANNDHVFRHRAPLFIAQFDTKKMCLLRHTERVAVPERGARLGNFGCTPVNENESWVTAAEWMQTTAPRPSDYKRCMKYGSDNSIWISKIKFPSAGK